MRKNKYNLLIAVSIAMLGVVLGYILPRLPHGLVNDYSIVYSTDKENVVSELNKTNIKLVDLANTNAISPLAVESTLFDYNNKNSKQDFFLLKMFNCGYKDWKSTSDLLKDNCFSTIEVGKDVAVDSTVVNNKIFELIGLSDVLTDSSLFEGQLISICNIPYKLGVDARSKGDYINIRGKILNYNNEIFRLPLENEDYCVFIYNGSKIYDLDSFKFEYSDVDLDILSYTWLSFGKPNKIISKLNKFNKLQKSVYSNLYSICKFGFNASDYHEVEDSTSPSKVVFDNEFVCIVRNIKTEEDIFYGIYKK